MGGVITDLKARTIIDSRGNPTVEVDCFVDGILMGRAAVPVSYTHLTLPTILLV